MPAESGLSRRELLTRAASRLRRAGAQDPRREALRILADHLGVSPGEVLSAQELPVGPADAVAVGRLIERRAAGEPLAYVTGLAGFRRLTLHVDRRALIPRPETEGLVDLVLQRSRGGARQDDGVNASED